MTNRSYLEVGLIWVQSGRGWLYGKDLGDYHHEELHLVSVSIVYYMSS